MSRVRLRGIRRGGCGVRIVLIGFGSSARRGATGWTDRVRVNRTLAISRPDIVVDGASPSDKPDHGADRMVHEEAVRLGLRSERCPYEPEIDGPTPRGFFARNVRQYVTWRSNLAAGFISGPCRSPFSSGSAHMFGVCLQGRKGVPPCPVVIYRDDGIEPYDIGTALDQLRRLYAVTKDRVLVGPGKALASLCECGSPSPEEVAAALAYAADGSRWAPWIEAVRASLRVG